MQVCYFCRTLCYFTVFNFGTKWQNSCTIIIYFIVYYKVIHEVQNTKYKFLCKFYVILLQIGKALNHTTLTMCSEDSGAGNGRRRSTVWKIDKNTIQSVTSQNDVGAGDQDTDEVCAILLCIFANIYRTIL